MNLEIIRQLLGSKKATMTAAGLGVAVLLQSVFGMSQEVVLGILGLFASYVLGQGVADAGKEAAKEMEH